MLSDLIFSLNATMPIFLMMVIGWVLKKINFIDEKSNSVINKLVFRIFLPALLFMDLAKQDFKDIWDSKFVLYCFITTVISIFIALILSLFDKDKSDRGEFIQASYRSAAATLGIAFMTNIYDDVAMVALMIIGSVPLYNTAAVLILSLTAPSDNDIPSSNNQVLVNDNKSYVNKNKALFKKTIYNLITNPIILSILAGLLWSVFKIPQPVIFVKSMTYLGNLASPLALICLGAAFEFGELKEKLLPIVAVIFNKLFLFCILFLPLAINMGYRNEKLVAILIMLGSATTSSSFIMSKNMGHKGIISSSAVMTTTLFSAFSLTLWLFILKTLGYI